MQSFLTDHIRRGQTHANRRGPSRKGAVSRPDEACLGSAPFRLDLLLWYICTYVTR